MRDLATSIVISAIAAMSLALMLLRIGNVPLWDDEAQVAIVANNYSQGLGISGFDGKHLLAYVNGTLLDSSGNYRNPPGDVWLTAASFNIFGVGTWQARLPFVLCGFLVLMLCIRLAKRHLVYDAEETALTAAWIGLGTSFLLYSTQCRYYAPSMLCATAAFGAYLSWASNKKNTWHLMVMATCLVGLYYFHYLLFICFCLAMMVQALLLDRSDYIATDWKMLTLTAATVLALTLPHALEEKIWHRPDFLWPTDVLYVKFGKLAWWNFRELSTTAILPLPLMLMALILSINNLFLHRIGVVVIAFGLILAMLSPQPTAVCDYSDIRYMSAIFPLAAMLGAGCCVWIHRQGKAGKIAAVVLCLFALLHNGLSMNGFFKKSTWLLPSYIEEVSSGYYSTATTFSLNSLAQNASEGDLIRCIPDFFSYPLQFYKGGSYRFGSNLSPSSECWKIVEQKSPWHSTDSLPDVIIMFGDVPSNADTLKLYNQKCVARGKSEYYPVDTLPCHWPGLDASRPELWVHKFGTQFSRPQDTWEKIIVWKR